MIVKDDKIYGWFHAYKCPAGFDVSHLQACKLVLREL